MFRDSMLILDFLDKVNNFVYLMGSFLISNFFWKEDLKSRVFYIICLVESNRIVRGVVDFIVFSLVMLSCGDFSIWIMVWNLELFLVIF